MKYSAISSCLSAVLLCAALLSCGTETPADVPDTTSADETGVQITAAPEEVKPVLRADLPETDFGGKTFTVLGRINNSYDQFNNFEIYAEKENGEVVNDAIFRRNTAIEDAYNVEIAQVLIGDEPHNELQKSVDAGDHLYDTAFIDLWFVGPLIQKGYFLNLYDVEHIDFSKPWWNPGVNEAVSLCGKLYATTSDFSLRDKSRAYILMYNKELTARYDIPDPVQTVRDGKWTVDLVNEYIKYFSSDLDGDGKMGGEFDGFGLAMDSYIAFASFTTGLDNTVITKDADDNPVITMNNEHMAASVEKIMTLTCDPTTAFFCNDFKGIALGDHWMVAADSFNAQRTWMSTSFPHMLQYCSQNTEFEYGVLPFPKLDEAQKDYITMADVYCMLFGIPATTPDPAFSGFMLEALSAASTDTTLAAYYDISCKTKYSYNPESGEMLDLIFQNIRYDPALIYDVGSLFDIITEYLPKEKENNFISLYEKYEKNAQRSLDKLVTAIGELEH
ncbi:MAG: hypothetical protein E7604_14750 [Ruminococcaceae bacterium]|nr:hypothetical protein [Oscillospiraceae bacterium]